MKTLISLFTLYLISHSLWAEKLIIGTSSFDPPMEIQATKDGVFTGFEIDLVNEVCRRIKSTCVYRSMSFKDVMIRTLDGRIDLGIDGIFITNERLAYFLFSQPYLQTKAQLFAMADSHIDSSNVNSGLRIGVEAGTVFKNLLMKTYNNVKVIDYPNQPDILQDLSDHKLDLVMFDYISASYWVDNSQDAFKLVGNAIPIGMGYGILANRNKGDLMARINKALYDMENDGTYVSIYSLYFK